MKSKKTQEEPTFKDKKFLKVGFLFFSLVIFLDVILWYLGKKEYLAFLDIFLSYVITGLIHLSGLPATMQGNTIYLTNSTWLMTTECSALFIMVIYTSFITAYPASWKDKGIALLTGIPFIFVVNMLRLYAMAWIDYLNPQYSEFFHNYMWQVVFIVMVVFMWLVWIDKVVDSET